MVRLSEKTFFIVGLLLILLAGISYSAQDVQALRDAKDSAERNRIQALIDGARAEGKLIWATNLIEAKAANHLFGGFKAYYGLPNLTLQHTNVGSGAIVSRVEQLIHSGRPTHDILWYANWAWFTDLLAGHYGW